MEAILTAGAIGKISSGEVTSENEMVPVLQVIELKQVKTQQGSAKERFRMVLSDGIHLHQGMLGTDQNNLVIEGTLQAGSIVRLTQFVCSVIKDRRIVIIGQLEVITRNSDIIGHPVEGGKPNVQRRADSGTMSNTTGLEQQGRSELTGGRQINSTETGRSHAAISPQVGLRQVLGAGSSFPASTPSSRAYSNPYAGHGVPRQNHVRDLPTSSTRQPAYQPQPPPPMYANRGPVARKEAPPRIIPINALSPYSGR